MFALLNRALMFTCSSIHRKSFNMKYEKRIAIPGAGVDVLSKLIDFNLTILSFVKTQVSDINFR